LVWIVGVTNAVNFIDGVDGLACGVGFFSASTMFVLSLFLHNTLTAFFAAALAGSILGFAVYNFAPASIFMGDSGSLFIGFIIAAISLQGAQKSSTAVVLLTPIVALGVPIADTLLAIIRRVGNGSSPFSADKEHIHHRLLRMGLSSRQVTLVLYVVCCLLGMTALLLTAVNNQVLTGILLLLIVITIGSLKILGYTADMAKINALAHERIQKKKRLLKRQRFADEILTVLQGSSDMPTVRQLFAEYLEIAEFDVGILLPNEHIRGIDMFSASRVFFQICSDNYLAKNTDEHVHYIWQSMRYLRQEIPPNHCWTMTLPLLCQGHKQGELLVGKYWESNMSLLENSMLAEHLKDALENVLERLYAHS
jgi:UDP-GlcNAc:undecaprenyl-phosphate GlcNAc-1-phosphate transferase